MRKQFSTSLEELLIKKAKHAAIEKDCGTNDIIELALIQYLYENYVEFDKERRAAEEKKAEEVSPGM